MVEWTSRCTDLASSLPQRSPLLIALSGCTGGDGAARDDQSPSVAGETEGANPGDDATSDSTAGSGNRAGTTTAVLSEQTFDATARDAENAPAGTVTTTLRALEVSGQTMTLRWAFRWDNPDVADTATTSLYDLSVDNLPKLTDTTNLKLYGPLCTNGSWTGGIVINVESGQSALVSSSKPVFFTFANHTTVEAWAVFAAPQDEKATFDVLLIDGSPNFASVTPTEAP